MIIISLAELTELIDEGMQQSAKDLVQLDEEVLHPNNLDEVFGLHNIAGHAWEAIRINLLCREECQRPHWGGPRHCRTPCSIFAFPHRPRIFAAREFAVDNADKSVRTLIIVAGSPLAW